MSGSLPPDKSAALKKAVRLQWISLGVLAVTIVAVGLAAGQSQAMRTAFVEDLLALLPPIAFLPEGIDEGAPTRPRRP